MWIEPLFPGQKPPICRQNAFGQPSNGLWCGPKAHIGLLELLETTFCQFLDAESSPNIVARL